MPDSEEVAAADGGAEDIPRNRVADIRLVVAEVAGNQRLQDHLRRHRCPAAVRHPHRTLDSHSIA